MRRAPASLGLLTRLIGRRDAAFEPLIGALPAVQAVQAASSPPPIAGGSGGTSGSGSGTFGLHTWAAGSLFQLLQKPTSDRHVPSTLPAFQLLPAAGIRKAAATRNSSSEAPRRGRRSIVSQDSEEQIAAARQRLQAHLQQQGGISQADAAKLAGKLSAKLGAAADELVPAPLQWFVGRSMQPAKAAALVAHICKDTGPASFIRQWPSWQPVFEANWQLADSCLAAYQQQQEEAKQRRLKRSESVAAMLSGRPSKYRLLIVRDLPNKLMALQQGQLGLSAAEVGQLIAAGATLGGTSDTVASAIHWLVHFAGGREAAVSMLRAAPTLLSFPAATLDSKVAALQAAWAGVLQPEQLQQLVQDSAKLLANGTADQSAPTAAVLLSWFPQPAELQAVLTAAPILLSAPATTLQANERWFMGPPLSLSRNEFLARVRAAPQPFFMNFAAATTQHKLAFLTQVGGVPLERAVSANHLNYLRYSTEKLAGRYFLLTEHGVPLPRHEDGGISLSHATEGLLTLLRRMRRHDSQGRLPADDAAALAYIRRWLEEWQESESGRRWAKPPRKGAKK